MLDIPIHETLTRAEVEEAEFTSYEKLMNEFYWFQGSFNLIKEYVKKKGKREGYFYFLTVNPDSTFISLNSFILKMKKLSERKIITKCIYVFEQRGQKQEEIGKGYHSHMILLADKGPKELHRDIYNTFKHCVGNKKHVDLKRYKMDFYDDKIRYIKGDKDDVEKVPAVLLNAEWRKQNNIEDIYICPEEEDQ